MVLVVLVLIVLVVLVVLVAMVVLVALVLVVIRSCNKNAETLRRPQVARSDLKFAGKAEDRSVTQLAIHIKD